MSSLKGLKQQVGWHELAELLGLGASREGRVNLMYCSSVREDKHLSLSVFNGEVVYCCKERTSWEDVKKRGNDDLESAGFRSQQ
ncbi:hypothetical protein [Endozoicomonas atrinae]|uniref:hypothetical protein n=1 Tax=Endozoicomonas atrinae TaxID=1333660 RepID=UPI000825C380|nr:hypothetical protein [Endozoicomonas atrinae]